MTAVEFRLIERLKQLPPECALGFLEFLAAREQRAALGHAAIEGHA